MTKYIKLILRFRDTDDAAIAQAIGNSKPHPRIGLHLDAPLKVTAYVPARMPGTEAVGFLCETFTGFDYRILTEEQAAQEPLSTWTMARTESLKV